MQKARNIKAGNPNDARLNLSKSQRFFIELYPDDTTIDFDSVLDDICSASIQYAYAIHDMDEMDDGTLKKPHCHLYCKLPQQQSRKAFAERFHIMPHLVQYALDERKCVRYLLHADDEDKFQYTQDYIVCNYDVSKFFDDRELSEFKCAEELIYIIVSWAEQYHCQITFMQLYRECKSSPNAVKLCNFIHRRCYFVRNLLYVA